MKPHIFCQAGSSEKRTFLIALTDTGGDEKENMCLTETKSDQSIRGLDFTVFTGPRYKKKTRLQSW